MGAFQMQYQQFSYGQILMLEVTIPVIDIVVGGLLFFTAFLGVIAILNESARLLYVVSL